MSTDTHTFGMYQIQVAAAAVFIIINIFFFFFHYSTVTDEKTDAQKS